MKTAGVYPILLAVVLLVSCGGRESIPELSQQERQAIVLENQRYRIERMEFFRDAASSPFQIDTSVTFHELSWFDVDPAFRGVSPLHRYPDPEVVEICATGGEIREQIRYGYFAFPIPDTAGNAVIIRLNVYKYPPGSQYYHPFRNTLSIWFTDETTGLETYGVGRYVDAGDEHPDPGHLYTIDLNQSYNPFCAYSTLYSCAIPSEADHIPHPIPVGERNYAH
ncbi:MAG: DUF1684 domain-containing protein [Ignavibacteria bacterium]|nr:DUF1684 domain-containing protein [Ignavibacteria bacterium]